MAIKDPFSFNPPVIQAPMAGGGDTPQLVVAVSNAGGVGFIGAAYLSPTQIEAAGREVRTKTDQPFGVNLFSPQASGTMPSSVDKALGNVVPFFAELGLPAPTLEEKPAESFEAQLEAALGTGASYFSFTFGLMPKDAMAAIKKKGLMVMGTATTVEEAKLLKESGVDAVIAQGSESGGHRGTFSGDFGAGMIGTMALVPQILDAVKLPVIASGGIMDGRGIVAALALGASAAQMGTAFLTCDEAGIPEVYKLSILAAREDGTRITRAFSGRPARGIMNRFMQEAGRDEENLLPFPWQNRLTRPLRAAAAKQGKPEFLSLWAGQGLRMARRQGAAELMARLKQEMDETAKRLALQTAGVKVASD